MPWPWLGNAGATARRREDLWRLLGPRPWHNGGVFGECLRSADGVED